MKPQAFVVQVKWLPDFFKHLQKMKSFSLLVSFCSMPHTQKKASSFSLSSVTEALHHLTTPSLSLLHTQRYLDLTTLPQNRIVKKMFRKKAASKICTSWFSDIQNVSATFCFSLP